VGLDGARIFTAMSPGPGPDRPERAPCSSASAADPHAVPKAGASTVIASEPREVRRGCTRTER
jgi:hypothetical protein